MYETLDQLREFVFVDVGVLQDGELTLAVTQRAPLNLFTGHVPAYEFDMHLQGVHESVGRISLRVGNTPDVVMYLGHIGYGVDLMYRGKHLAARSCRLLLPLATSHHLDPVWITCNPDNWASRRT